MKYIILFIIVSHRAHTLGCCQLVCGSSRLPLHTYIFPPFHHFFPTIVTVDYFMRFLRPRIFMRILCLYFV